MKESKLFFEGNKSTLYLLPKKNGTPSTIVKVIKDDLAASAELIKFKNECYFTQSLSFKGIRKALHIGSFNNQPALYLEYVEGTTLKNFILNPSFDLHSFFEVALQIIKILEEVHKHNIIHKNINSHHILVNPESLEVNLINFGIASQFSFKTQYVDKPVQLEGNHAYISPEQTGRMNRKVEYRTDIYSLGVTFYEMLSQRLPFEYQDALELIHAHLAKTPVPLHTLGNLRFPIPYSLSLLVNKMMAKNAENRYQSIYGIKKDLEKIQETFLNKTFLTINIGSEDISGKFQIPEKLYGRDDELQILNNALRNVKHEGKELVLVEGNPGVGKSSLITELCRPITSKQAFFIQGKFDQFQKNIPYFAWVQAIEQFIDLLLTENKEQLNTWKTILNQKLNPIGKVLTDLIPDLELILGPQPAVPILESSEAQNRFKYVLKLFIKAITNPNHPLIVFIDDWQWADNASIDLLSLLLEDQAINHVVIIAAYRNNDIEATHPFAQAINNITENNRHCQTNRITLGTLSKHHVEEIIADTIQQKTNETSKLAELVYAKTAGNAFFVIQFLQTLYTQKLIKFDYDLRSWVWEIHQIQQQDITDNVVKLMTEKIHSMPPFTQEVLNVFASIGNQTNLFTIAEVLQTSIHETFTHLSPALEEELILFIGDIQHLSIFSQDQRSSLIEINQLQLEFKFAHDSIQQAAYASLTQEAKDELHLKIGRSLYKKHTGDALDDNIFQIANQFNQAINLVQNPDEKYLIARLNLLSGQKARNSIAFAQARKYIHMGIALLPQQSWEEQYTLTLQLHNLALETDYLVGKYEKVDHWMYIILTKAKDLPDQITAYKIKISALKARNKLLEAVETAEDIILKLGIKLPKKPTKFHIIKHMVGLSIFFRGKKVETFVDRPRVVNDQMDTLSEIVEVMGRAVFFAKPNLLPILVAITNKAAYQYNHPLYSPVAYSAYGLILSGVTGDIELGYRFGQVAQQLIDKTDSKHTRAATLFNIHALINHWKEPLANSLPYLEEIYTLSRETGNHEYAGFAISLKAIHSIFLGKNLKSISQYLQEMATVIPELNQRSVEKGFGAIYQFVLQLTQPTPTPQKLDGIRFHQDNDLTELIEAQDNTMIFSIFVMQIKLAYVFEDFNLAYQTALDGERFIQGGTGVESLPVYYFYCALSSLAHIENLSAKEKKKALKDIKKIIKQFKTWATYAPANYQHRLTLIRAELARVQGSFSKAKTLYDEAIAEAHQSKFMSDEAVAWEIAARYYQQARQEQLHQVYLKKAFQIYQSWGATEKVNSLRDKFPQLLSASILSNDYPIQSNTNSGIDISQNLDLKSIVKGSQILSGEIKFEKLLRKMMNIVIENAGAQRGILLLNTKNQLLIEAEVDISLDKYDFLNSIPLEKLPKASPTPQISSEIVYYVARTQESLVLHDASAEGDFTHIDYIKQVKPKSILCTPLLHQGNLSGVLYLENPLVKGVFTVERIETLNLLSSQMAISIENAKLYENLEENVIERTIELAFSNKELNTTIETVRQQKEEIIQQSEELRASHEKLEELSSFKESMTHMLIHDAKQPLSPLVNSQDKKVRKAANQVLNMLENVLEIQKFESNEAIISLENISMGNLMDSVIHQVRDLADDKLITIKNSIALHLVIKADPGYITRVLSNLLGNAIKYIPTKGIITLESEVIEESNMLKVWIKDNGSGIPDEHKSSIFEKFGRIDKKDQRSTGLGLAFCQLAIHAHGGEIGVLTVSEIQALGKQGAWFYFTIPLADNKETLLHSDSTGIAEKALITQEFSPQDYERIKEFIPQLKEIDYYDAGKIMILLQNRAWKGSPALEAWIDRIPFTDNETHYRKMLAVFEET